VVLLLLLLVLLLLLLVLLLWLFPSFLPCFQFVCVGDVRGVNFCVGVAVGASASEQNAEVVPAPPHPLRWVPRHLPSLPPLLGYWVGKGDKLNLPSLPLQGLTFELHGVYKKKVCPRY
jgi:hypothetical protein